MRDDNSKQVLLSVLGVAILVVAVVGISFAAFSYSKTGEEINTITTGTISMNYEETSNAINLTDALPMSDDAGKLLSGDKNVFDFTVSASINGDTTINYAVVGTKITPDSTLPDEAIKVYLTTGDSPETEVLAPTKLSLVSTVDGTHESGAPDGSFILDEGTFANNDSKDYRLRMWIADDYSISGATGTYKLRVDVYGAADAQ